MNCTMPEMELPLHLTDLDGMHNWSDGINKQHIGTALNNVLPSPRLAGAPSRYKRQRQSWQQI